MMGEIADYNTGKMQDGAFHSSKDRANLARHILKGQKDLVDRQAIALDIVDVMEGFDADTLTELYEHVKFLRKRGQLLPEQSTDGQSEGFDGKLANPMPIKEE